jgi:predicted TPR repeat methyltransferase
MPPPETARDRLHRIVRACARGETPPNVALLKLLMESVDAHEVREALREALRAAPDRGERERVGAALTLLEQNPQAFTTIKTVLRGVEHGGTAADASQGLAAWAAAFDRLATASPEGSVALYALGNPDLFRAATQEVVACLKSWDLVGPDRAALDLGCGIGRLTEALAPELNHVTGVDISPAMIAHARERCAAHANVTLRVSSGRDLSDCVDESLDLILAADVFPYLVQVSPELVASHIREAARVLRPGGSLVILNMSYRDDPARDLAELTDFAYATNLVLLRSGRRPFRLWDATVFQLAKPPR